MIYYEYDQTKVKLEEVVGEQDVEFTIQFLQDDYLEQSMKAIQKQFDENDIFTDAMFYTFGNHEYRVVVRKDYYVDFILSLMKYKLVKKVEWRA